MTLIATETEAHYAEMLAILRKRRSVRLISPEGESVELPEALMAAGQRVVIVAT